MCSVRRSSPGIIHDDQLQLCIPFDLCTATSIGDTECVRQMLALPRFRAQLNAPNKSGWTPAMYSAYYGHDEILEILIQNGTLVNSVNINGQTALILAVKCGNLRCCDILLKNGASIDNSDSNQLTALGYAACAGYDDLSSFLIKNNANINKQLGIKRMTPLMLSAAAGQERVVKVLVDAGANVDLKSASGQTARDIAYEKGHYKVANMLSSCAPLAYAPVMFPKPQTKTSFDAELSSHSTNPPQITTELDASFPTNLASLLNSIGLTDYITLFEKKNITLQEFLNLTNENLKELGVDKLGPRCKMTKAISRVNSRVPQTSSPGNKVAANRQQLEIESLKEKLAVCEAQLVQERLKSVDLGNSGLAALIHDSMLPLFNLEWQSEMLKENVKCLRKQLWDEHSKLEQTLMSQLLDKVQDVEKLSTDMHGQIAVFLEHLKQIKVPVNPTGRT